MEPGFFMIYGTAGIASAAAICAPIINRFRNVPAGIFAFAGGIVPWLIIAMLYRWPNFTSVTILSLISVGPLFLVAIFFYSLDKRTVMRDIAATVIIVGLFAGVSFSAYLGYALLLSAL